MVPAKSWLDAELVRQGRTSRSLAEQIGVDKTTVSRWRNGTKPIKAHRAMVAGALGVEERKLWPT